MPNIIGKKHIILLINAILFLKSQVFWDAMPCNWVVPTHSPTQHDQAVPTHTVSPSDSHSLTHWHSIPEWLALTHWQSVTKWFPLTDTASLSVFHTITDIASPPKRLESSVTPMGEQHILQTISIGNNYVLNHKLLKSI